MDSPVREERALDSSRGSGLSPGCFSSLRGWGCLAAADWPRWVCVRQSLIGRGGEGRGRHAPRAQGSVVGEEDWGVGSKTG